MCTKLLFHAGYMISEQKKPRWQEIKVSRITHHSEVVVYMQEKQLTFSSLLIPIFKCQLSSTVVH